jgi:hypothetical protein
MLMLVLDDPNKLHSVLDAWENIGITGVTILESTGIQRIKNQHIRAPLLFPFDPILHDKEVGHLTLLTLTPDESAIQKCVDATETIVGNLDLPNTGIFAAWPITYVKGINPYDEIDKP